MRAVDTNVLVRLVTGDDPKQTAVAEEFIPGGAWVSHLALAETVRVLDRTFDTPHRELVGILEMLLDHATLTIEDPDVVKAALDHYRHKPTPGFTDCLMVEIARKAGHVPLGTFDKALARLPHVQKI